LAERRPTYLPQTPKSDAYLPISFVPAFDVGQRSQTKKISSKRQKNVSSLEEVFVHCNFVRAGAFSLPAQHVKLQASLDQNF
jgi:hypothetical protein